MPASAVGEKIAVPPGPAHNGWTGAGEPGHGDSWPSVPSEVGPGAGYGPEPLARNGKSWTLFGTFGFPTGRFSGKMNVKFGAVYTPGTRLFGVGLVGSNPFSLIATSMRLGGRNARFVFGRQRQRPKTVTLSTPTVA